MGFSVFGRNYRVCAPVDFVVVPATHSARFPPRNEGGDIGSIDFSRAQLYIYLGSM